MNEETTDYTDGTDLKRVHTFARKLVLGLYTPRAHDATSLVRALGPFRAMEAQARRGGVALPALELRRPPMGPEGLELSWDWMYGCDVIFVQRPWLPLHVQLCVQAKMLELPLWVDWDDDYLSIHPSNPNYHHFAHPNLEQVLRQVLTMADAVTVSTSEIGRRLCELEDEAKNKMHWVPNACMWNLEAAKQRPRERRVTWRGGASHELDMTSVLREVNELARLPQFCNWEWAFLGDIPWQVVETMPKDRLLGDFGAEPWLYMEALGRLAPYVHIVPLAKFRFNPAKSNLAWLEATAAGAVTVAPDWEEWRQPGVMTYEPGNAKSFQTMLRSVMESWHKGVEHPCVELSRQAIRESRMLEQVNGQRWEILRKLTQRREEAKGAKEKQI